jgi:hypothetical protein
MKHLLNCIALLLIVNVANASFVMPEGEGLNEPIAINLNPVLKENVSINTAKTLPVKKGNFFNRLAFKLVKSRLAKKLGIIDNETEGFNIRGFVLGLFLPLIGVLGAYIFTKDRNFIKWAWIGTGTYFLIFIIWFTIMLGKGFK